VISLGIDPGKHGAIAELETFGHVMSVHTMPLVKSAKGRDEVDVFVLKLIIQQICGDKRAVHAWVEKAQPLPPKMGGGIANFHRGYGIGLIEGMLASLSIPYTLVNPKAWQKVMLEGTSGDDTKAKALHAYSRLQYPRDLLLLGRSKKPHDGIVDAVLIAEYGRRQRGA
jgi:hypothetical protein